VKIACHAGPWREDFAAAWPAIRDAGFAATETYCLSQWFDQPDAFREILDASGLSLVAMEYGGDWILPERAEVERDAVERLASFLSRFDADSLIVSGGRRHPEGASLDSYDALAAVMNRLGETCRESGVHLCYHPKRDAIVEYRDQIELVLEKSDPSLVFLCLDTGDLARSGSDPLEVVRTYGDRIRHLHLKDLDWKTHRPVVPGKGSLELDALLQELQRIGCDACLTVELEDSSDPSADALAAFNFLRDRGFAE
jgi:inosose dehydratase